MALPPGLVALVVFGAWALFFVVWLAAATRTARTVERAPPSVRGLWLVLILAAVVFVVFLGRGGMRAGSRALPADDAGQALGLALLTAGIAVAFWARWHLGRFWSAQPVLKEGHQLVRSGPYRWGRNPIYSGLLLAALGSAIAVGTWAALVAVPVIAVGIAVKIVREERLLRAHFGEEFERYRREVKALIPFVL